MWKEERCVTLRFPFRHRAFDIQHSRLQHSTFSIQHSAFGHDHDPPHPPFLVPLPALRAAADLHAAPYREDLDGVDVAIWACRSTADVLPGRHPARAARDPQPVLADAQAQHPEGGAVRAMPVADLGTPGVHAASGASRSRSTRSRAGIARMHAAGITPMAAGGDHSISLPILRAIAGAQRPVGMVHFDAHCDTGSNYLGSNYHHGAPFCPRGRGGPPGPEADGPDRHPGRGQRPRRLALQPRVRHARDLHARVPRARLAKGDRRGETRGRTGPTYVSFDIDSLDPPTRPAPARPRSAASPASRSSDDARPARPRSGRRRRGRGVAAVRPPRPSRRCWRPTCCSRCCVSLPGDGRSGRGGQWSAVSGQVRRPSRRHTVRSVAEFLTADR